MKSWTLASTTVYEDAGYRNREHYLRRLANSVGLSYNEARGIADDLGHKRDFSCLPSYLDDLAFLRSIT